MTTAPEATPPESIAPQSGAQAEASPDTLQDAAEEWLASLRAALARAVDITVLEARLAALNVALILIVAVVCGLLLATAWIALFAAIASWLHELGLSWTGALLSIATANLVIAGAGTFAIYRMSNNLLFNAIRKFIRHENDDAAA